MRALLGLGGWKLEADDGRSYVLMGSIPASLEGKRVIVSGEPDGLLGDLAHLGVIRVEEIREDRSWC